MIIEYIGHSCFYLVNKEGVRTIIDPYDNTIGLAPVKKEADIALITHHHFDHDYIDGVMGDFTVIDTQGKHEVCGVSIIGLPVSHGEDRGEVISYIIESDGMRILHLGDVGEVPSDEYFAQIGKIDILMVPVGGTYTTDAAQAVEVIDKVEPNITIPMHYKTNNLTIQIKSVHEFMTLAKKGGYDIARLEENKFEITADNLKKRRRVLRMENSY